MSDEADELGMTPEQHAQFVAWTAGFPNQDENGVDLSLLRANLKLTPEQRIRKLEAAAMSLREVKIAGDSAIHPDR